MTGSSRRLLGLCLLGITAGLIWFLSDRSDTSNALVPETAQQPVAAEHGVMPAKAAPQPTQPAASPDEAPAEEEDEQSAELDPSEVVIGNNPDYATLDMRLAEMQARRDGQSFDPEQVISAMGKAVAWQQDDSLADALPITDEDRYDGRAFIRYEPLKVETLMPGDTMDVPVPQANSTYQMQVNRVEAHGDGSVTWHGHLKDFEGDNQVTITQSNGLTYAGVTTPDASYVLQVYGEAGWIVNSGTLFKGEDVHVEVPGVASTATGVGAHHHGQHDHSQHHHGTSNRDSADQSEPPPIR